MTHFQKGATGLVAAVKSGLASKKALKSAWVGSAFKPLPHFSKIYPSLLNSASIFFLSSSLAF